MSSRISFQIFFFFIWFSWLFVETETAHNSLTFGKGHGWRKFIQASVSDVRIDYFFLFGQKNAKKWEQKLLSVVKQWWMAEVRWTDFVEEKKINEIFRIHSIKWHFFFSHFNRRRVRERISGKKCKNDEAINLSFYLRRLDGIFFFFVSLTENCFHRDEEIKINHRRWQTNELFSAICFMWTEKKKCFLTATLHAQAQGAHIRFQFLQIKLRVWTTRSLHIFSRKINN